VIRRWLRRLAGGGDPNALTTSRGWERYARRHAGPAPLGDEWNLPEALGIDVAPDQIVPYLDRELFGPFLGTCDTIVEIGPGGGRWTAVRLPRCRRLVAADTSSAMLALLRRRFAGDARLECVALDGQGLAPVAAASADAVFSFDVFVHLPHWDAFNYLCEIRRVLRPGGKAVVHHGNVFSELGWANFLSELPYTVDRHKSFGTFAVMTPELMRGFVERAGLDLVSCRIDVVRRDAITFVRRPA
jgi:SAM-dependent methyltransferase